MANSKPQSYANHGRIDPWFHLFAVPVVAITFIGEVVVAVRHPGVHSAWMALLAFAAIVLAFKARLYALRVQDRVIRLEERLRLALLLPENLRGRIGELSLRQLIGLRFASDEELASLVQEALAKNLGKDDIKKAIRNWRADNLRV